jgi:hypothetical protein
VPLGAEVFDGLASEPTIFLTTFAEVAEAFDGQRCTGDNHRIIGSAALSRDAGHFPLPLYRLVVDCLERCWAREAGVPHQDLAAEEGDEDDGENSSKDDELHGGEPDGNPISKDVARQVRSCALRPDTDPDGALFEPCDSWGPGGSPASGEVLEVRHLS